MPSLGSKTIKALLKGANDTAPARTQLMDVPNPLRQHQPEMMLPGDTTPQPFPVDMPIPPANQGYGPGTIRGVSPLTQVSELPWKGVTPPANSLDLEEELLQLIESGDEGALKSFSKTHFGIPWKVAAPHVEQYFGKMDVMN